MRGWLRESLCERVFVRGIVGERACEGVLGRVLGRVRACGCVAMASASFEGNGEAHAVEDASTRADGVLSVCTDDLGEPGSDRSREGEERRRRNPQESNETTPPGPEEDGGANLAVPKENHGGEGDSDLQRNASTCWGEDPSEEGASNTWKRGSRPFRKTAVQKKKKDTRNHGGKTTIAMQGSRRGVTSKTTNGRKAIRCTSERWC